jgi:hypothetical protein
LRSLCLEIIFWANFRHYGGCVVRGGDSRIPSWMRLEREREAPGVHRQVATASKCSRAITMVDLHDAVWVATSHSGGAILTMGCCRQTLETLRPVIVPDDDFVAVEALQQQIGNTQTRRTKELENINDKVKGKVKILRSCTNYLKNLKDFCGHWKLQRHRVAGRRPCLRQADMRK